MASRRLSPRSSIGTLTSRWTWSRAACSPVAVASPIREFGYVEAANAKITELTGAEFGPGYGHLIADGSFVMDSEAAARGVVALRQAAPERIVDLVGALQNAFYRDGRSLSDPATYRGIAEAAGLDADAVVAAFESPTSADTAQLDFARAASLGVHSYPTLLAGSGDRWSALAVGDASADEIDRQLNNLTTSR